MKRLLLMALTSISLATVLASCVVPARHGGVDVLLPPPLPVIVDLGPDRHYHQGGYDYYYEGKRWQYSRDRDHSRSELPRSHWPREIRHRGDWK